MKKPFILFFIVFACSFQAWGQTITTIAGNGAYGNAGDGGTAIAAVISPWSLAIDTGSNLYISCSGIWVRKINTLGYISTVIGNTSPLAGGYTGDGGPATASESRLIMNIASDKNGNLYTVDESNNVVRKVSTSGIITTIAGNGFGAGIYAAGGFSGDGGPATDAELRNPTGVAVDDLGNVYIGDDGNGRIRKVDNFGIITTIAGGGSVYGGDGGPATAVLFDTPWCIATDDSGNVYAIEYYHNRIRKISVSGIITTVAGNGTSGFSGDGGPATDAELNLPWGITVDASENIYIVDLSNERIRKVSATGIITTIAGNGIAGYSGDGGPATAAELFGPRNVAVDRNGNIYIADLANYRIRKICPGTPTVMAILGHSTICPSTTILLTDSTTGGIWNSSDSSIAKVDTTGEVTGIALGTATISYSAFNNCGTAVATKIITVNPPPSAGSITGSITICPGTSHTLIDVATGGIWSSNNPAVATVGSTGIVYGVTGGMDTIAYTVTNSCSTAVATTLVTVNPSTTAGTITGTPSLCAGSVTTLGNAVTGGIWSSSATTIATISSGSVTGVAGGAANISYLVTGTCGTTSATMHITVNPLPVTGTILGPASFCALSVTLFTDAATGGTWGSSSTSLATITAFGFATGVSAGMDTITYSVTNTCGTVSAVKPVTIIPLAVAGVIAGPSMVCPGTTISLGDTITGGTWSSFATSIATISAAGVVTGISPGVDTLYYAVTTGCSATSAKKTITVTSLPTAGTITGTSVVCAGSSVSLSDAVTGGIWSSNNTGIAAICSAGIIAGVASGTANISYTVSNSCGTAFATRAVTVYPLPGAGTITGLDSVCVGASVSLTDTATGGIWSSSPAAGIATISGTGMIYGISAGRDTISYSVSNSCGVAVALFHTTVSPLPFAGTITGASVVCADNTILLSDFAAGGIWAINDTTIATISGAGVVSGMSAGSVMLSYSVTNSCGTAIATKPVTVNPLPEAGTISGNAAICEDSITALIDAVPGGIWSSSNTSIASMDSSGVAMGVTAGTSTISYSVSNSCGTSTATEIVTVVPCTLGINTLANTNTDKFSIFPNPSPGTFTIILSSAHNEEFYYTITDMIGKQVKQSTAQTNHPTEIKLNVPPGIYFITVSIHTGKMQAKLVVE